MFDKIEFSDLYKFKTSIGLILIAIGIILPWLFLKQESSLLIDYQSYNNLIPNSKLLIDEKLSFSLTTIKILPWLSACSILSGLSLTFYGYYNWKKKQKIVDATEQINYDNLKANVKTQNFEERRTKAESDIEEEINSKDISEEILNNEIEEVETKNDVDSEIITPEEINSDFQAVEKLMNMENLFADKINSYNTFNYLVKSNVQIANQFKVDFLLNAFDTKKLHDIIIEIKYFQSKLSMEIVRDSFNKGIQTVDKYYSTTRRISNFILIIIYKKEIADKEQINRFIKAIEDFQKKIGSSHKIVLMDDSEVINYDIKQIIN